MSTDVGPDVGPRVGPRFSAGERTGVAGALVIDVHADAAIRRHASRAYPHECCGALLARDDIIVEAFPLSNTTAGESTRRFLVGPEDYTRAEARARQRGVQLAGFYHSHPDHPARPSQHDLDHAWPNLTYLIISVIGGEPADLTAWHLLDDRSAFEQGELTWRTRF
jgi:proteasome lid subunit RPN8/RPN11